MKTEKLLALASVFALLPSGAAHAQGSIEVGVLTCSVVPGSRVNLIIRSTADVNCVFAKGGQLENYQGETGIALGLDLSFNQNEKMAFTAFAASSDISPGTKALGGKYVGGELSAAAGLGLGAKTLIGGGNIEYRSTAAGAGNQHRARCLRRTLIPVYRTHRVSLLRGRRTALHASGTPLGGLKRCVQVVAKSRVQAAQLLGGSDFAVAHRVKDALRTADI